jgi:type VI secretion system protein ImpJ
LVFADEIPEAVQWHEGMLLAPQHFQQSAARIEMLLQYSALLLGPYCWGVRRLALDTKLLPAGKFRVLDLEAVMPDGSVVSHHPRDEDELMGDLAPFADEMRQSPVVVHLTLPARSAGDVRGALPRYRALEGDPVPDLNTGEGELRVPRLRPRLGLIIGKTPPPKYLSLPLAEIRFVDEAFTLTDYIPPTMAVPLRSPLGELCGRVAMRLRQKALYVSEQMRAPSVVLEMSLLTEHRDRIQALVGELPRFEATLSTGVAHPLSLFLSLCSLAGQLAILGDGLLPPVFAPYNHSNPVASFQEVVAFVNRMLDQGIPETYQAHPFQYKDGVYALAFQSEWAKRRLVLGMRASVGVTEKEMRVWGEECLIGSASLIPSLRDKRILGVTRQYAERDPELIAVRGVILFTLEDVIEFIKPGDVLQVLNFGERGASHRPLEMVLYVKGG